MGEKGTSAARGHFGEGQRESTVRWYAAARECAGTRGAGWEERIRLIPRAAAVNTNNGEYRSVNCVLGLGRGSTSREQDRHTLPPPPPPPLPHVARALLQLAPNSFLVRPLRAPPLPDRARSFFTLPPLPRAARATAGAYHGSLGSRRLRARARARGVPRNRNGFPVSSTSVDGRTSGERFSPADSSDSFSSRLSGRQRKRENDARSGRSAN